MKFSDFVNSKAIKPSLTAGDKEGVIRELVAGLVETGQLDGGELESIVAAILNREELGSTGIGRGIAVPHTKHPSVGKPIGTVGISHDGIEFQSLDGEPVQLFFMLISPPEQRNEHVKALGNIAKQLADETFCRFLKQAKTAKDIQQVLEEADNNQFVS